MEDQASSQASPTTFLGSSIEFKRTNNGFTFPSKQGYKHNLRMSAMK